MGGKWCSVEGPLGLATVVGGFVSDGVAVSNQLSDSHSDGSQRCDIWVFVLGLEAVLLGAFSGLFHCQGNSDFSLCL